MSRRFDLTQCGGRWKVPFMHPKDTDGICPLVDGAARATASATCRETAVIL